MQQLYLSDLGDVNPNATPDVTASMPDAQTETDKGEETQTLNSKKGETAEMEEETIPNPAVGEGVDEDTENIKIAEDALKSLVDSISSDRAVPDASASLAHDKYQDEIANDAVADSFVQQDETVTGAENNLEEEYVTADEEEGAKADDSTEDDVTIMKIVGDSRRKKGKSGVGNRLRVRKEKVTEVVTEEPKSTKQKKNVATEATKTPKKRKVAAEATTSTKKKKMYGPVRRSSRVEIPAKQKKHASKRKTINLSDS